MRQHSDTAWAGRTGEHKHRAFQSRLQSLLAATGSPSLALGISATTLATSRVIRLYSASFSNSKCVCEISTSCNDLHLPNRDEGTQNCSRKREDMMTLCNYGITPNPNNPPGTGAYDRPYLTLNQKKSKTPKILPALTFSFCPDLQKLSWTMWIGPSTEMWLSHQPPVSVTAAPKRK